MLMNNQFAQRATIGSEGRLAQLFGGQLGNQGIKFSAGNPDPNSFPTDRMGAAINSVLNQSGNHLFEYQTVAGPRSLRTQLANRMKKTANITTSADQILLTTGGQQALDLVGKLLLNPGDGVAVESPTYVGALAAFDQYEPTYYDIDLADDGLDIDRLEHTLRQHPHIKLLYTVPDFHNPTGITMSAAKRQRLVQLADQYDFYILEDTPYRDLSYVGSPLPAIKSFDQTDRVIFISSFSKILMPGLRLGWVTAGPTIINKLRQLKETNDLESPALVLAAVDEFMQTNDLDQHIATLLPRYRQRLTTMIDTLDEMMPKSVHFTRPTGGFFIWVTLPTGLNAAEILNQVIIPQGQVSYVPGRVFYAHQNVTNTFRLNFSGVESAEIIAGITRLTNVLRPLLSQPTTFKAAAPTKLTVQNHH